MSYTVLNGPAFKAQVAAQMARVKKRAEDKVVAAIRSGQMYATNISPVYSGDFASNWNVKAGSPDTTFNSTVDYYGPEYPEPKDAAWGIGGFDVTGYTLGVPIFLSNAAEHDEPYAWKIEKKDIVFRPINQNRGEVRAKTLRHIRTLIGGV